MTQTLNQTTDSSIVLHGLTEELYLKHGTKDRLARKVSNFFLASEAAVLTLHCEDLDLLLTALINLPDHGIHHTHETYLALDGWNKNMPLWKANDWLMLKRPIAFWAPGGAMPSLQFKSGEHLKYVGLLTRYDGTLCDQFQTGSGLECEFQHPGVFIDHARHAYFESTEWREREKKQFVDARCNLICTRLIQEIKA